VHRDLFVTSATEQERHRQEQLLRQLPMAVLFVCAIVAVLLLAVFTGGWLVGGLVLFYGVIVFVVGRDRYAAPFEIDRLFLFFLGMYCVFPYVASLTLPEYFGFYPLHLRTAGAVFAGLAGFLAGHLSSLGSKSFVAMLSLDRTWEPRTARFASVVLIAIGTVLVLLLISQVSLASYLGGSYIDIYAAESGWGFLSAGLFIIEAGILVLALTGDREERLPLWSILLFVLFALVLMRVGRRRMILELGLGMFAISQLYVRPFKLQTIAITGVATLLLFAVLGDARGLLAEGVEGMTYWARNEMQAEDFAHGLEEFGSFPLTLEETMNIVDAGAAPQRYGMTYVEAFELLVPQKLYPERPLSPGQWFVNIYDPKAAAAGGGYSFSLWAEGYLNFGFIGVLLVGFAQGVGVRMLSWLRVSNPQSRSRMLIYAAASVLVISMIRGDFATLLKTSLIFFVPALVAAIWLGKKPATFEQKEMGSTAVVA